MYVGIVLVGAGASLSRSIPFERVFQFLFLALTAALCIWIWRLNQVARKKHFEPLLHYYAEMREALDQGGDFALDYPGPPSDFLKPSPYKPLTKRARGIWIAFTAVLTLAVAAAGIMLMQNFDERTGIFIASAAPVVTVLMVFVSGLWRRGWSC